MNNKIKIFLKRGDMMGEKKNVIYDGLVSNPRVEIVKTIRECDYIILTFRDFNWYRSLPRKYPRKLIVVDFRDQAHKVFNVKCFAYFKRSIVKKNLRNSKLSFVKYGKPILPITYSIRQECLTMHIFKNLDRYKRDIDISIFFPPAIKKNVGRCSVARFIKNNFPNNTKHVGIVGKHKKKGRNSIQNPYFNKMFHSKIVVTCNPSKWEGDYRTWEAIASGALVFVDRMLTPVINPLIDGKHIIFYNKFNLEELKKKILYYLENEEERLKIAKEGYNYCSEYHKSSDRIDEILSVLTT